MVRALRPPARLAERKKWIASPIHGPLSASAVRPSAPTARSRVVLSATALSPPSETSSVAYSRNLTQHAGRFPPTYRISAQTRVIGASKCVRLFATLGPRTARTAGSVHYVPVECFQCLPRPSLPVLIGGLSSDPLFDGCIRS